MISCSNENVKVMAKIPPVMKYKTFLDGLDAFIKGFFSGLCDG